MNATTGELNKKELLSSFDDTTAKLLHALSLFNEEELNTVPFEGSWTAGQVGWANSRGGNGLVLLFATR